MPQLLSQLVGGTKMQQSLSAYATNKVCATASPGT